MSTSTEGWLTGAGEVRLFWRAWTPPGTARASVVIAHGAGEHSGRYEHVGGQLAREGYATVALDHRGHGRSHGPRALLDRMAYAVADLDELVLQARRAQPEVPLFLLGHSMGGTISLCYAAAHQDRLDGLILSGALAATEAAPALQRAIARTLSRLAPQTPVLGIDSTLVSRDPEVVRAYREDPLVHHRKLPARTLVELDAAMQALPVTVERITIPTLIMYGTADRLVLPSGSLMVAERIGARDVTLRAYEGLHHEILNEPEREQVLADMIDWLAQRSPIRQPLK